MTKAPKKAPKADHNEWRLRYAYELFDKIDYWLARGNVEAAREKAEFGKLLLDLDTLDLSADLNAFLRKFRAQRAGKARGKQQTTDREKRIAKMQAEAEKLWKVARTPCLTICAWRASEMLHGAASFHVVATPTDTRGWVQLSCQTHKINIEGFTEWRDSDKRSRRSYGTSSPKLRPPWRRG